MVNILHRCDHLDVKMGSFRMGPIMKKYEQVMTQSNIDYGSEDGCCPVFASCVTISNPHLLPSGEPGVNLGIRSWKSTRLIELDVRKPLVISISERSEELTLQPALAFDNLNPRLKSGIFKCISWLNGSLSERHDRDFLKEGVMTYLMTPIPPPNSPTFFLSSPL
jgi:hypothetical protein